MDWGEVEEKFLDIQKKAFHKSLHNESEAQTRFDVIDRIIKEILQWKHGQISVEERNDVFNQGFVDYILRAGDYTIVIEAKKIGASFPVPSKKKKLKLTGPILGSGEIKDAIEQAEGYAITKEANVVVVTNGDCWCFYPFSTSVERTGIYANMLFPLDNFEDAEEFFNIFSCGNVESGSLDQLSISPIVEENKLLNTVYDADARVGRNNIADLLSPALDNAFYSENILNDTDKLSWCFVSTEGRKKFDNQLKIHLEYAKPKTVSPAPKLRRDKSGGEIEKLVSGKAFIANPVTVIIGTVGSGKTTYLKHFELIQGKKLIDENKTHWIYLDFEKMGKDGNPRSFIYDKLNEYLLEDHPTNPTDYKTTVEPAYEKEIEALARGPYGGIYTNKEKFNEKVNEVIHEDYLKVEPYVRKILTYLASHTQCVVVLDNIDLYEDEELETKVLSEAISISKEVNCNVIVCLRDTTYVNHRNDSIMNAYELKKLWLDPPPFKEVLSKRLLYSKKVLENESAEIKLPNSMKLKIPDLSIFFEIVQSSLLSQDPGRFLESISDRNIRNGIKLVRNFLTSGHVHADLAIRNYLNGETRYKFPYHEVFKGAVLSQWKYYKEERAEVVNLFDSGLGSKRLLLSRAHILQYLFIHSKTGDESKVKTLDLVERLSIIGMSEEIIFGLLNDLAKVGLIRDENSDAKIGEQSSVFLTLTGAYYIGYLCGRMIYVESVMMDTPIFDSKVWDRLVYLTGNIEQENDSQTRLKLRQERLSIFIEYLIEVEKFATDQCSKKEDICTMKAISDRVDKQTTNILARVSRRRTKAKNK